jgi:arginine/serine-rich splicing factor 4/5/6
MCAWYPSRPPTRPVFLGNLNHSVQMSDVEKIFTHPITDDGAAPVAVERVDLKRGFCFVFLKDAENQEEKERAESYVARINGMYVVSAIITTNG